jgi:hypothetical protein
MEHLPEFIAATVLALGVLISKRAKEAIMGWLMEWAAAQSHKPPSKSSITNQEVISNKIHELLITLKADRAYIFEFHNGSTFSTAVPCWKMSCTYEHCREGISYQAASLQNILISIVIDHVKCLWGVDHVNGTACLNCCNCNGNAEKDRCPMKGVYEYRVDRLPEGYSKAMLKMRGIETMLLSPILNKDHSGLIGFVGVDYCSSYDEPPENYNRLCCESTVLGYMLHKQG